MSYSRKDGDDTIIFYDEESYEQVQKEHPAESLVEANSVVNPETGEFNWDCPCLGGMADPPCGSFFKEAFTCFYYSEAEPKGIDCVEKFQDMQACFRQFPEIYANEIKDDDDANKSLDNAISGNESEEKEELITDPATTEATKEN
ncbi:hypothetical protein CONCODRAFT_79005 [Conidiobolus coronatus NRRL 28638]|uniref:Mitochondrial intermembrane space import and assembly protein 40 n=1 Tax=Conidiobolus coronatus (strain ATCC 28846 / CBS 209.66 / NRRL 28638) TaxID=796925 RepID=A0A137P4Z5_CONC2|nr:hypothetical protein CONCODRAFT_79005 [Conidiobolus coronatus NRRL 28638]|eukprot:KXN70073.1 hypothetical protein CONCODRAFT_79005 [Conidiobolus coronatus NRRL 28638]